MLTLESWAKDLFFESERRFFEVEQLIIFVIKIEFSSIFINISWSYEKHAFSSAILQNEIGWFDDTKHASAMLASRLETDASLLRSIIIDCSATLLHNLGLIITSFIITFILNWRLTLVILATFPLLITANISEVCYLSVM